MAGRKDLNDVAGVSIDPTSPLQISQSGMLAGQDNLIGSMAVNPEGMAQAGTQAQSESALLGVDSIDKPVHGQQESSASTGHRRNRERGNGLFESRANYLLSPA